MSAAIAQKFYDPDPTLVPPSTRYIAEYVDVAVANAKVAELDRFIYGGRPLKVETNAQPRGRFVPNLRLI